MKKLKFYSYNYHYEYFDGLSKPSTLHILSKMYMPCFNILNDRFDVLNKESEYRLCSRETDIHNIWNLPFLSFEECCHIRTTDIIRLADKADKDIYISYSGGVDSTLVVVSFLMHPSLKKHKFHVLYNKNSVDEYPYFMDVLRKNKVSTIDCEYNVWNIINQAENGILVSGLCGDQLDGSNLHTKNYKGYVNYFDNWIDAFRKISCYTIGDKHIADIMNYAKCIGMNTMKYFGEFAWLFNFGIKWTYVAEYMQCFTKGLYFPFFDTDYFSRYALSKIDRLGEKKQDTSYNYKTDWKKIIYSYTKDDVYFLYKGKDANYIGGKTASPGFIISTDIGYTRYDESKKLIYDTMIDFIKPEYKNFYKVCETKEKI